MSNTVIKVENLGKQYRLGDIGTGTISHDLNRWWAKLRGKEDPFLKLGEVNDRTQKGISDFVWALKDVSFDVNQGDVLGIIGKNGAGKSTLLKILSRTTSPTTGSYKVKGRIASLLEVGTGFHPELSGRENIFLNGAILGMTKSEIKSKFDEIVDFSGVERYIDTPVKRYSSGMYVRLAFGVAAHLESEILIVDEVLAVGDQEFQDKCIGKMKNVSSSGRTVIFVSHNMAAVKSLCTKGILMSKGSIQYQGSMQETVQEYIKGMHQHSKLEINLKEYRTYNSSLIEFSKVELENITEGSNKIYFNENIKINFVIDCFEKIDNALLDCKINTIDGVELIHAMNQYSGELHSMEVGSYSLNLELQNNLQPGTYNLTFGIHHADGRTLEYVENCLPIEILSIASDDSKGHIYDFKLGYVRASSDWKLQKI